MNPAGCGAARRQGAWEVRWDKKRPRLGCEPPHEVVSGQRWPCSPRSRACCRPVSAQGLCRVRVRFWCWSRDLWCTPAPKFPLAPPGLTHPHSLPVHTHTGLAARTPALHARTHASELFPQAWERTCGLGNLSFPLAFFLQLALQATGREREPLSSHTSSTHARGRLAARPALSCKRSKLLRRAKSERAGLSQPLGSQTQGPASSAFPPAWVEPGKKKQRGAGEGGSRERRLAGASPPGRPLALCAPRLESQRPGRSPGRQRGPFMPL